MYGNEQTKAEHPEEAALHDDAAGKAYVEKFAAETLERADRVMQADKVTKYASHGPTQIAR
jgi:vacuolar protein sorting-associated protein VTA1